MKSNSDYLGNRNDIVAKIPVETLQNCWISSSSHFAAWFFNYYQNYSLKRQYWTRTCCQCVLLKWSWLEFVRREKMIQLTECVHQLHLDVFARMKQSYMNSTYSLPMWTQYIYDFAYVLVISIYNLINLTVDSNKTRKIMRISPVTNALQMKRNKWSFEHLSLFYGLFQVINRIKSSEIDFHLILMGKELQCK